MTLNFSEDTEPKGNDSRWKVLAKTLIEWRKNVSGDSSTVPKGTDTRHTLKKKIQKLLHI